jgi:hypothetical protein
VDSSPFGAAVTASSYPASNSYTVAFWLRVTSDIAGVIYADGDGASTRGFSIVHKGNVNGTHTLAACVVRISFPLCTLNCEFNEFLIISNDRVTAASRQTVLTWEALSFMRNGSM